MIVISVLPELAVPKNGYVDPAVVQVALALRLPAYLTGSTAWTESRKKMLL